MYACITLISTLKLPIQLAIYVRFHSVSLPPLTVKPTWTIWTIRSRLITPKFITFHKIYKFIDFLHVVSVKTDSRWRLEKPNSISFAKNTTIFNSFQPDPARIEIRLFLYFFPKFSFKKTLIQCERSEAMIPTASASHLFMFSFRSSLAPVILEFSYHKTVFGRS